LSGLLRTVEGFAVSLAGDAPAQPPLIGTALVNATVAMVTSPRH
jgi:hypothetical protein